MLQNADTVFWILQVLECPSISSTRILDTMRNQLDLAFYKLSTLNSMYTKRIKRDKVRKQEDQKKQGSYYALRFCLSVVSFQNNGTKIFPENMKTTTNKNGISLSLLCSPQL